MEIYPIFIQFVQYMLRFRLRCATPTGGPLTKVSAHKEQVRESEYYVPAPISMSPVSVGPSGPFHFRRAR